MLAAAVAALTLGVLQSTETPFTSEAPRAKSDILIVGNDPAPSGAKTEENATGSANMGKEEGWHSGSNQGVMIRQDSISRITGTSRTMTLPDKRVGGQESQEHVLFSSPAFWVSR